MSVTPLYRHNPLAPARRVLAGNTATPEQRKAAADLIAEEGQSRRLTDAEIHTIGLYHQAAAQGDSHMLAMLTAMNEAHEDNRGAPMLGWLLLTLGVVIGAALALMVLA